MIISLTDDNLISPTLRHSLHARLGDCGSFETFTNQHRPHPAAAYWWLGPSPPRIVSSAQGQPAPTEARAKPQQQIPR